MKLGVIERGKTPLLSCVRSHRIKLVVKDVEPSNLHSRDLHYHKVRVYCDFQMRENLFVDGEPTNLVDILIYAMVCSKISSFRFISRDFTPF